ncbi:hypothetical protein PspLS_03580 [Pyricularia sp. CBS 133598]|nr:hypothetical protein PspLS_03580 [Pyricularia sp. CBS 133598]
MEYSFLLLPDLKGNYGAQRLGKAKNWVYHLQCDEGLPTCSRCRYGGRDCAYAEPPIGCFTWHHLLHSSTASISSSPSRRLPDLMIRGLDYFRCEVASKLGGELDGAFWTTVLLRLATTEDAVMHGMLAISLLFEDFEPGWKKRGCDSDKEAALIHYNRALRIVASKELGTDVVLVMSILFTCVEFLRGNQAAAVTHCRHGTLVSRLPGYRNDEVMTVLRQLSPVPYFFSSGDFPVLETLDQADRFDTVSQASHAMDELMAQAIRLVRSLDDYRLGVEDAATMPAGAQDTQMMIVTKLTVWKSAFEELGNRVGVTPSSHALLLMRFRVCWIWSCIALRRDETTSDLFQADFSHIVDLAGSVSPVKGLEAGTNFLFGMGMSPLLHFVVIKCRHLPTRLKALEMLRTMGKRRESLWDAATMYRIGEVLIKREHGVSVVPGMKLAAWELPADEKRVRDSYMEDEVLVERDHMGKEVLRRRIYLFPPSFFLLSTLAAAVVSKQSGVSPEAGLAGPAFPRPSFLRGSDALASAIGNFDKYVDSSTTIQSNQTAWAVAVFSTNDAEPLYERYYTPEFDVGVLQVDRDSVFRIASVSKVFSVWSFLLEVGDAHFNDPITGYVPELATFANESTSHEVVYDDIDQVRWEEVTLGQLAGQLAGIPRDPAQTDLSAQYSAEQAMALGLPPLADEEIPQCGVPGLLRSCTRGEMISQLLKQHPVFSTAYSPAYSNVAYALLGFAQEAATGTPVGEAISTGIMSALNMTSSSYNKAPKSGGVIPGNPSAVGWDFDLGTNSPSGALYSSTGDMIKAGQAILGSKTMKPAQTRRWLKPMSQTGVLGSAVGAPWEIRYLMLGGRVAQLYTKQGDIGGYRAAFLLSPEHDLGAIIFSAGPLGSNSAVVRETLMNAVGSAFLPMAEDQARLEARKNLAGVYKDFETNSSVTIDVDDSITGLTVKSLSSRGTEIIGDNSPFINMFQAGRSARLFPSNLQTVKRRTSGEGGVFVSRLGFRASFFNVTGDANAVQDPGLMQWTSLGAPTYGARTLDDWVFELSEDGTAKAVDVRMLRVRMGRGIQAPVDLESKFPTMHGPSVGDAEDLAG